MKKLALFLSFLFVVSCTKDPIIYTLTTSANPSDGGTVSPSTQQYDEGKTATITATASSEFLFQSWSGATGSTNSTSVVMNSDKSVTANFVKKKYALTTTVEGEGTVTEKVIKAGAATDYNSGTIVELTAVPSGEWLFVEWKGDLTESENPTQITIDKAKSVTAVFVKKQYPLTVEVEGEGTVTEEVIKQGLATDYNSGTIVELTAVPTGDWEFIEWTGDLTGSENPVQITIDGPKTVKARFIKLPKIEGGKYYPVPKFLANPIEEAQLIIPVIIINYIPSTNGITITDDFAELEGNIDYGNKIIYNMKVESVMNYFLGGDIRQKWSMEEGSRYHGQEDSSKKPYLGYKVLELLNLFVLDFDQNGQIDYFKLFEKINLKHKVEDLGVKEVWFNHFPNGYSVPESNMSSPHKIFTHNGKLTSDVSNSYRNDDDLPIYDKTYVVYGQTGWYANNLHNRGHQIEAQLAIWETYRNNYDLSYLFYQKFGGYPEGAPAPYFRGGRVGLVHYPPNAEMDYDYDNSEYVDSDILDWKPNGGGTLKSINKDAWHYNRYMPLSVPQIPDDHQKWRSYVNNVAGGDPQGGWLIYWMQSIPSLDNNIPYNFDNNNYTITNWWDIIYKWDETIINNTNLFE
ncbi:hypothetical protein N9H23_01200 [Flavobacteriaceae bacterium]|nr:hypothetical protein [Flavobacteriaceae bacterium]